MNRALEHRGPDGHGQTVHTNVGLAHRRLAIIDPATGQQPILNDDESVALTFNGEVYNYVELRAELERDFTFRTTSDTEVVLRAFEAWGIECVARLRGMFAFAVHDRRAGALYLVRDRAGIKPLHYYAGPDRILFASELQALSRADGMPREIDPAALSGYFRYQYVPAPQTIYRDVHKLEPGHWLRVDTRTGEIQKRQYWNVRVHAVDRTEDDWLEELDATLDEAIALHVRSDVPFGAFLSGGMDSSIVTALMARQLEQPVRSFAIGFAEEAHSELPYAAAASRAIGSQHVERVVSPDLAEATFVTIARHFGEPFADSSAVPTYYVSEVAAGEVKMVLSGDGGDELFAGYNSYQHTYRQQQASGVRASATSLVAAVGQMLTRRRRPAAARDLAPFQADHDRQREIFPAAELQGLLRPVGGAAPAVGFEVANGSRFEDPLARFQAQDFKTYMVDDVLTKVDRMSMANSLEVRVPLLDHKVIELAFALPTRLKIRPSPDGSRLDTKWLLRQSARRFYTEEFLARPKQGFGIPVVEWCQGPLRPVIEGHLREDRNPIYDWIDRSYVQSTLDEFFGGRDVLVARVWALMMFDLWWRHVHGAA